MQIGKNLGGKTLKKVLARQSVKAGVEFVANLTPVGWAKLAFDGVNDTIPVFTSYFSGNAASSEYYLTWDSDVDGVPYISDVSERILPSAKFTYTQKADFAIELDASTSVKDPSTSLSYEWSLNNNAIGNGQILTHNFEVAGNYTVTLNITDDFGNTANHDAQVKVDNGLSPVITSLSCSSLGGGNVEMSVNFEYGDNNVEGIYWYNEVRNPIPLLSTSAEEKKTIISFNTNKKYAYGKVIIEDAAGNTDYRICKVNPNELLGGRYIVKGATAIDTVTSLEWQRCVIGYVWNGTSCSGFYEYFSWQRAFNSAKNSNIAGYTDWRLPNKDEILSLIYCSSGEPDYWLKEISDKCSGDYARPTTFSEVFLNAYTHQSLWASEYSYPNKAWTAIFSTGRVDLNWGTGGEVRLVRDAQRSSSYKLNIQKYEQYSGDVHSVISTPGGINCSAGCNYTSSSFNAGENVTLSASAGDGYEFHGWKGDCVGNSLTCILIMDRTKHVVAEFGPPLPNENLLTVNTIGSGVGIISSSPSGIDCGNNCSAGFSSGSTVTLTANPDSGYVFGGWSGACSGSSTTCTVTMNTSKTVTAQFIDGEIRDKTLDVCDVWSAAQSGGYGTTVDNWDISAIPSNAIFDIKYNAQSVPDKYTVEYAGATKLDTGWRGSSSYNGDPLYPGGISGPGAGQADNIFTRSSLDSFRVTVFGPENGTSWDYQVRCREN